MKENSIKNDEQTYEDESLEKVKKDMCQSGPIRRRSISNEEIQNKIDELNLNKAKEEIDEESTININDILLKNIKSKKTSVNELKNTNDIQGYENNLVQKEIVKEEISFVTDKIENTKLAEFEVIKQDPYLRPFENKIRKRNIAYKNIIAEIEKYEGSFWGFCEGYRKLGLNVSEEGIYFREYAPAAKKMSIVNLFIKP